MSDNIQDTAFIPSSEVYKYFGNILLNSFGKNGFLVNLKDIYKFMGYSKKDKAKNALCKNFTKDIDFQISLAIKNTKGGAGKNEENIMLTVDCFKKFAAMKNELLLDYFMFIESKFWSVMEDDVTRERHEIEYLCALSMKEWTENELSYIKEKEETRHNKIAIKLANNLNGNREVKFDSGVADVVTQCEIIEVKPISEWQHGIGQLICYSFMSDKQKHLYLFGGVPSKIIVDICNANNIKLSYEE